MKVFLDTNVLIDMVVRRENRQLNVDAITLLNLLHQKEFSVFVSPISVSTFFYVAKNDEAVIQQVRELFSMIGILPIDERDVRFALHCLLPDREDAMQMSCAERGECDVIITRDTHHFAQSPVPVFSPLDFIGNCAKI